MKHSVTRVSRYQRNMLVDISQEEEIDLADLLHIIWKGKILIVFFMMLCATLTALYTLRLPTLYEVDILLTPSKRDNQNSLNLSSLGALAGVSFLNQNNDNDTLVALEVLKSRSFITSFIDKYDLKLAIGAANGWNKESNQLTFNEKIYDIQQSEWLKNDEQKSLEPTDAELHKKFIEDIFYMEIADNFYTIGMRFYSPSLAKEWTENIVKEINDEMRNRVINETKNNLNFLRVQLAQTPVTALQNTLYSIITEQTKSLMLAETQEQYVFTILDPAYEPDKPVNNKLVLMLVLGILLGAFLGVCIVVTRYSLTKTKK